MGSTEPADHETDSPRPDAPFAKHGRLRSNGAGVAILKLTGIVAAVALVSVGSIATIGAWSLSSRIKTVEIPEDVAGPMPEIGALSGGFNILLVGSDSRANSAYSYGEDEGSELNDVNMLLHVSNDHTNAVAISFPRDLEIPLPECADGDGGTNSSASSQKINTALDHGGGSAKAGLGCVVATVSQLTGLPIPYAATISFDGVIEMSNAIGGVSVCIAEHLQDSNTELDLPAGTYDLQGVDALKFLRTRYGVGDGSDTTRISSQQVFLSSLVRKVKSSETLTDVRKLYGLAGAAVDNMVFSESLNNIDTLVSIARAMQPIALDKIAFVQYPTVPDGSALAPDYDSAQVLLDAIVADQSVSVAPPAADDRGSIADPNAAPVEPTEPSSTESPAPAVALPDAIKGQSAAEQRCTVGRSFEDQ